MNKKNTLTLYTFQPIFVWECLNELGFFHPFFVDEVDSFLKEEKENDWGFFHAYQWLKYQMNQKGIKYHHANEQIIWAWYQWAGENKKAPDKRYQSVYNYFEDPYVLLELEINPERVLLSDYDAWHYVLNYWHLSSDRESEKFSKSFDFYRKKPLAGLANEQIQNTWLSIFDLDKSKKILNIESNNQQIQATFFELFFNDVKKVHFFENKKCQKIINLK